MSKEGRPLTARQKQFVVEYLVDLNAAQAAIRAGYSAKTAETCGPRLLRFAQVAKAISEAKQARVERTEITQDRVLAELSQLAFSDITHYEVDAKGNVKLAADAPAGAMRAVQSIKRKISSIGAGSDADGDGPIVMAEVEIKLWDKPGPLKLAGRHVGLFPDKLQLTGKDGAPLVPGSMVTVYMPSNGRENERPEDEIPESAPTADGAGD